MVLLLFVVECRLSGPRFDSFVLSIDTRVDYFRIEHEPTDDGAVHNPHPKGIADKYRYFKR